MIAKRNDGQGTKAADVSSKFPNSAIPINAKEASLTTRPKTKAIAGFVSTSILSSTADGFFGENAHEERIDDSATSSSIDARPLYDRLKEKSEQKDAEWKEQNNMFAPPKALDTEETAFLQQLHEEKKNKTMQLKRRHEEDLKAFANARASSSSVPQRSIVSTLKAPKIQQKTSISTITCSTAAVKKKQKVARKKESVVTSSLNTSLVTGYNSSDSSSS